MQVLEYFPIRIGQVISNSLNKPYISILLIPIDIIIAISLVIDLII